MAASANRSSRSNSKPHARSADGLGLPCDRAPTLGIYCEDELGELRRRQVDIRTASSRRIRRSRRPPLAPPSGRAEPVDDVPGGFGELTPFHAQLLACARKVMARVVIIDTAADAFGGNENDRGHVRQFVQHALGSIAKAIDGAVLLCAHPSRAGLASGEGDGGSTGWSNALRSRLFLRSPPDEDGAPADANARILQRRKSNYATRQDEIRLRWRDGVIEPEAVAVAASQRGRRSPDDVFLDLLAAVAGDGRPLSAVRNAGNFAPTVFAARPDREGYRKPDFVGAMERRFAATPSRPSNTAAKATSAERSSARRTKLTRRQSPVLTSSLRWTSKMKSHSDADAAVLRRSIGKQTAADRFIALILQAKRRLCGGCAAAVCGGLQNVNDINVRRSCAGAAAVLPHTPYRRFHAAHRVGETPFGRKNGHGKSRETTSPTRGFGAPVRSSNGATWATPPDAMQSDEFSVAPIAPSFARVRRARDGEPRRDVGNCGASDWTCAPLTQHQMLSAVDCLIMS